MKVDIFLLPSNGESTSSSDLEGLSCGVCSTVFGVAAWKENKNRPQRRMGGLGGQRGCLISNGTLTSTTCIKNNS